VARQLTTPVGEAARHSGDRRALTVWLATRVALIGVVLPMAAFLGPERHPLAEGNWVLDRFAYWDSYHFILIAEHGYFPPQRPCCDQAYFPGYPVLIAAARPLTGGSSILAGLVVSMVSGTIAAALLWRMARERTGNAAVANNAVLFLALTPLGIFLTVVYSEPTFLAFAVGAWWAGSRHRWWLAGALAAGATAVRVNGLFLLAGLVVMYAVQPKTLRRHRPRMDLIAFSLPVLPVAAFMTYLHARTGSWNAWSEAQQRGWGRHLAWHWDGMLGAWRRIGATSDPWSAVTGWGDLLAVTIGLAVLAALLWLRRWPEATYVGLSLAVIVCSTLYVSAPRYALSWFPVYLLLGELATRPRWRWLPRVAVIVCLPLMVTATLLFTTRHWLA
jgi:hypothetical protein